MNDNWIVTRRRFLGIAGTTAAGLLISPALFGNSSEKIRLRFGLLSDVHYADRDPAGTRFYRQSLDKMKECITLMNQQKLGFIVELGDFKDQDAVPDEANTLNYLDKIEFAFRKFNGATYHVLGNHDMDGISKQQFLDRVENTGIPKDKSYYSFVNSGIRFIVLDGNFTKDGTAYDRGNFSWTDTFIPEEQLNWLKAELNADNQPAIVFIHQMLDDSLGENRTVSNAKEVRNVLEENGNVQCVFQGHVHEEHQSYINGIPYYSVKGMVDGDGKENNAYQIVSVLENGNILVDGYRRASTTSFNK